MYRVRSSGIVASGWIAQPLTEWKSKALSVTALVFRNLKVLLVPRKTNFCFYHYIIRYHFFKILWFLVFDLSFKWMVETCAFTKLLLVLPKFVPQITLLLKFKTQYRFFNRFSLLLFVTTDFFNEQCSHLIETSQLICFGNQLTGFYMMGTLLVKMLNIWWFLWLCTYDYFYWDMRISDRANFCFQTYRGNIIC